MILSVFVNMASETEVNPQWKFESPHHMFADC